MTKKKIILVPDHKNFQRNLHPDFSVQQSAEREGNLHQVVESESEAGQKKMGQIPKNFCGRVLGIDPGTRITGYGVIDTETRLIDFGCIRPPPKMPLADRYKILFESLESLIERHQPEAVAVETQFVLKNAQSAIKLGMAKGMVFLAAARQKIPIYEFAPKQAKLAVVGHGGASKFQVQKMIQSLLCLPTLPEPEDAADALALAICCVHHMRSSLYV